MVEIYGLYDPDSLELRYVGKAKDAKKRFKRHLEERSLTRPINNWVRSLVQAGKLPVLKVLETVEDGKWEEAERRLIAHYRQSCDLLNVADGGAMPSQTKEQRRKAARASNLSQMKKHPAVRAVLKANFEISRLHAKFMKQGDFFHAYHLKFMMRCWAAEDPVLSPASWQTL
jgi:hypothetical protein